VVSVFRIDNKTHTKLVDISGRADVPPLNSSAKTVPQQILSDVRSIDKSSISQANMGSISNRVMKTFAQIFKEHLKLCSDKMRTIRELLNSAKNVTDPEARYILTRLTDKYFAEIDEASQLFDSKFGRELKNIQTISEDVIK